MQCLKPAPHVVSRMIQGKALILHHQKDEIQQLNEVASLIWSCILQESFTIEQLIDSVVSEFEVSHTQAQVDIELFLTQLQQQGLVQLC